jgi:hypothetical protein
VSTVTLTSRPINSAQFQVELGIVIGARDLRRAVSRLQGRVAAQRLVAAGFGEFQPIES